MQSQEWKLVRTKTDDPLNDPPKTLVMFNDQPLAMVQSYSLGQNSGNAYETLLLEVACPKIKLVEVTHEELDQLMGKSTTQSKYQEGGEKVKPDKKDSTFALDILKTSADI